MQNSDAFYVPLYGAEGDLLGIWVQDADHPNLKMRLQVFVVSEGLPVEVFAKFASGNYRRVENSRAEGKNVVFEGGAFLMLGDAKAPSERKLASAENNTGGSAQGFGGTAMLIGTAESIGKLASQALCPVCGGRMSPGASVARCSAGHEEICFYPLGKPAFLTKSQSIADLLRSKGYTVQQKSFDPGKEWWNITGIIKTKPWWRFW